MFNLCEIKDTIKIEPSGFRKKKSQAITDEVNRKYANKVKRFVLGFISLGVEVSIIFMDHLSNQIRLSFYFIFFLVCFRLSTKRSNLSLNNNKSTRWNNHLNGSTYGTSPWVGHVDLFLQVLQDIGLCIAMHDIISASEGFIHHGDGCSYVTVHFRMVIFRPFVGEIITGKIRSSSQEGVRGKMTCTKQEQRRQLGLKMFTHKLTALLCFVFTSHIGIL